MSLIYSMLMSVDGYVEDEHGRFDLGHSIHPAETLNTKNRWKDVENALLVLTNG